jgi:flagellar basal-body rod protein FlgB
MPSPDSNTVDVQIEQAALAENNIQWQAAYRFLNGKLTGLRTAIRGE